MITLTTDEMIQTNIDNENYFSLMSLQIFADEREIFPYNTIIALGKMYRCDNWHNTTSGGGGGASVLIIILTSSY